MGSSKKHKEKDKERKHKKRHRHRDSRSPSHERERSRRHKSERDDQRHEKEKSRHERTDKRDRDKRRKVFLEEDNDVNMPPLTVLSQERPRSIIKREVSPQPAQRVVVQDKGHGSDLSLTIEETNRLRAKLGLKPLDVGTRPSAGVKAEHDKGPLNLKPGEEEGEIIDDFKVTVNQEDVHVPAINMGEIKKSQKLKERMAEMRQKRLMNAKLGKVKSLADSDDELESAMAWVKRNRKQDLEKQQADKRAKLLDQMDEEFGLSDLVEEEFGMNKNTAVPSYGAHSLAGLKVHHAESAFKEGKNVILTLQDQNILDENGEDVLVNVNLIDEERADENVQNKKNLPQYKAYDGPELDEFGNEKPKSILGKYDEEISGKNKKMFKLGGGGEYDAAYERKMTRMHVAQIQRGETLTLPPPMVAREFFTEEEMSQKFKKIKKKERKIRKKPKVVKASDLIPVDDIADHGRRNFSTDVPLQMIAKSEPIPGLDLVEIKAEDMEVESSEEIEILGPEEDLSEVQLEEDGASLELEIALKKARKLKHRTVTNPPEQLAEDIESRNAKHSVVDADTQIILNSTSEFCRSLGEIPTYGQAGNREQDEDGADMEQEWNESHPMQEGDEEPIVGWQSVEIDTRPVEIKEEEKGILDDEPVLNTGLGGALELASKKGYLEGQLDKRASATSSRALDAQIYSIEDKRYDDLDDKYRKRERYTGGAVVEFKEKNDYKPNVQIDYVDDTGRVMSQKEAFRYLSHSFHGKGSGKKKTEKRSKKIEEEMLMKSMSSTDTPLNTVKLLQDKQRAEKSPYVILSGSSKGLTAGSLTKQS